MRLGLIGLVFGAGFGFVMAWAGLSDPVVIHDMLLMRDAHVFLLMGSAVVVAGLGARVLRARNVRALATGEPIGWASERPQARHVVGSLLFGTGWSIAGTCPGPVAVMVGQGRLAGLAIVLGILGGAFLQGAFSRRRAATNPAVTEAAGL